MTYTLLNKNNNIIGVSKIKLPNSVEKPFKPFCENIAKWNGKNFEYNFGDYEEKTVEKKYLRDTVVKIGHIFNGATQYINGTETREHNGNISVLIPCYKKSEYLMTAVKSCLKQTQKPTEIVVLLMDEDSYALEEELISLGVVCYKEEQMNVCRARTYLAEKCTTDWLIFLDADDYLFKDYIEVLDKFDSAFIMASQVLIDEKYIRVDDRDTDYLKDKVERITQQNMTALMHKDVFFNIGLKEEFCKGGEDFDFLLRLAFSKKWKFDFTSETHFVYNSSISDSLTKSDDYYKTYLEVILANKEHILESVENNESPDKDLLQIYWYLNNPTEKNLELLAIKYSIEDDGIYSSFDYFEDYVYTKLENLIELSKRKNTNYVYSEENYKVVGDVHINKAELENRTFDAIIYNLNINTIEQIVDLNFSMIIRKDIYEEIQEKELSGINALVYLLKNYSCFVKNNHTKLINKIRHTSDEFPTKILDVTFDKTVKETAKIISEGICESMYLKNPPSKKWYITYILHKKCNLHCEYCNQSHEDNLSDEEIFNNFEKAIDHIKEALGTNYRVQIMGGEPTIWSDWLQNKVIEKLKEYPNVHVLTNGTVKSSPIYSEKRFIKHLHLVNWKSELELPVEDNVIPLVILSESDRKDFNILSRHNGRLVVASPCKSSNPKYNLSFEGMKELASLSCGAVLTNQIKEFVNDVELFGIDKVRNDCRNGNCRVLEIDCSTFMVRPCSNSKIEYPLCDFNFRMTTPETECKNCNFTC